VCGGWLGRLDSEANRGKKAGRGLVCETLLSPVWKWRTRREMVLENELVPGGTGFIGCFPSPKNSLLFEGDLRGGGEEGDMRIGLP